MVRGKSSILPSFGRLLWLNYRAARDHTSGVLVRTLPRALERPLLRLIERAAYFAP